MSTCWRWWCGRGASTGWDTSRRWMRCRRRWSSTCDGTWGWPRARSRHTPRPEPPSDTGIWFASGTGSPGIRPGRLGVSFQAASTAAELGRSTYAVTMALIRHGIPRRPAGTPKGLPSREEQAARLRHVTVQELRQILVEADTDSDAATALGVSHTVLTEAVTDAGIDRERVGWQRRARRRIAAWPALLQDRDSLAEALDKWAPPTVARLAGCSLGLVRAAADHHHIQLAEDAPRPGPRWTHQPPAPLTPSATAGPEHLNAANATRTQAAAARAIDEARDMLRDGDCPVRHQAVLQARVDHPWASLAELGAMFGTSKDAYAAMLRRALTSRRSRQPLPAAPSTPHAQATAI
jgi:hypothetical protein